MEDLYSLVHYWLVGHPIISQFEFKHGQTFGATLLFPIVSMFMYLSFTILSLRFPLLLPMISAATLRRITATHSLILCTLSLLIVVGCSFSVVHQVAAHDWTWIVCYNRLNNYTNIIPRGSVFFWAYVFYLSKILEFIDTLLIILSSSRSRRLSFLHVYHHAMVPLLCYMTIKNSQSMLHIGVITNASVHVLMYAYYFLSAIGKRPWWKKLVTDVQIVQFMFCFVCLGAVIYYHLTSEFGCSGIGVWFFTISFNVSLLALFLNFHFKTYANNVKKNREDKLDKQT
ncbi:uncharacterized protein LOC107778053 [Nicotiana tabacum]|uniref:Elongation of fatty acids protein DDB_G0272012 n=1 Tax=Nicotiana tabacum TaxID=4097 RepID=A0A1S3YNN3_TOBAC|nr:PREDICTED: putative elongation of fatty acids protein DDB_G0272012 [Nicotiana tabacum]